MPEAATALIAPNEAADGLNFGTPEYDFTVQKPLKTAIDRASGPAMNSCLKARPCLVTSVSAGCVRTQANLKNVPDGVRETPG